MQYISEEKRSVITFCTSAGRDEAKDECVHFSFAVWKKIKQILFQQQKSIVDLLYAQPALLNQLFGFETAQLILLLRNTARVDCFLQKMIERNTHIIVQDDEIFPFCLQEKLEENCPEVLYARGNIDLLLSSQKKIAVTGTRKCALISIDRAKEIAMNAAQNEVCIVSGGAKGIDIAVQQSILGFGGSTIVVLPYGLEHSSIHSLEEKLNGRYLLLSPFSASDCFTAGRALYRNHLIYALGHQAIVVESGDGHGGTWNGANHALKNGYCTLYAVDEPRLNGNMRLIGLQAKKYKKWDDYFGQKET